MLQTQDGKGHENKLISISKKGIVAIVVIAICIAASVAGFFVLGFGKSPLDKVEDAVVKTAGALAKRSEVLNFAYSFTGSESLGISVSAENIGEMIGDITGESEVSSYIDADLTLESAVGAKNNSFMTAKISSNGEEAVAGFYKTASGNADVAFLVPGIIDEAYGFSISTIGKDLEDSILAPGSGSEYALDTADFDQIKKAVDALQTLNQFLSADDLLELAAVVKESDATRLEFKSGKEEITIGEEKLNVNVYKGTLTTKTLKGALDVAARWLDRYYKLSMLDMTFAEATSKITENILENDLELELEFDVYNGYIVRLWGALAPYEFTVDFGPDPEKTEMIRAVVARDGDDVYYDIDISKLAENEISISSGSDNGSAAEALFSYDDSEGSLKFQYDSDDLNVAICGGMTIGDDTLVVADPVITSGDYTLDLKGLSAKITNKAEVKKLSNDFSDGYINIFTMSEKDADNVMEKISEAGQLLYEVIEVDFYNILLSIGDLFR